MNGDILKTTQTIAFKKHSQAPSSVHCTIEFVLVNRVLSLLVCFCLSCIFANCRAFVELKSFLFALATYNYFTYQKNLLFLMVLSEVK